MEISKRDLVSLGAYAVEFYFLRLKDFFRYRSRGKKIPELDPIPGFDERYPEYTESRRRAASRADSIFDSVSSSSEMTKTEWDLAPLGTPGFLVPLPRINIITPDD